MAKFIEFGSDGTMSDHASHEPHAPGAAVAPAEGGMRFEKSELDYFVDDDRNTGKSVGVLLALIFCFLVVFMTGVALWTSRHKSVGSDPFAAPPAAATKPAAH